MTMTPLRRILNITLILCFVTTLFTWIAWRLGYEGFLIVGEIELPKWVERIIRAAVFNAFVFLELSFATKTYGKRAVFLLLPFSAVWAISALFNVNMQSISFSGILPTLYIIAIILLYTKDRTNSFLRLAGISIAVMVYQAATIYAKTGALYIGYNGVSLYQGLVYIIDLSIIYLLLYFYGKGEINVANQQMVLDERVSRPIVDKDDNESRLWYEGLTPKQRVIADCVEYLTIHIPLWIAMLAFARIGNIFFEVLASSVSFVAHGYVIYRKWHCKKIWGCAVLSWLMFFVAAQTWMPFELTQLSHIVIGLVLLYGLYCVANYQEAIGIEREIAAAQRAAIAVLAREAKENQTHKERWDNALKFELKLECDYNIMKETAIFKGLTETQILLLDMKYCKSKKLRQIVDYFGVNYEKHNLDYPPAYTTVRDWIIKAETLFSRPLS